MEIKKEIIFLVISLCLIDLVSAVPPIPNKFIGNLIIDDKNAPVGTEIKILIKPFSSENFELKGSVITTEQGKYNLTVTAGDFNDEIKFKVNGIETATYKRTNGDTYNVNLQVWADRDNDGVSDTNDKLIGDSNSINDNFNTLKILINDNENLSGSFSGVKNLKFKDDNKVILDFEFNFDNTFNLYDLEIKKQTNDEGSILIKGMPSNVVKSVYIDKLKSNSNSVCVLDDDITSISEISVDCSNGVKINCPGTNGDYSCAVEENIFKISGLKHSGVKEFYIAPPSSPPNDGGGSSGGSAGGGGGGGGGGASNVNNAVQPILPVLNLVKDTEEAVQTSVEEKNPNEITGAVVGTKGKINWTWIFAGAGIIAVLLVAILILKYRKR